MKRSDPPPDAGNCDTCKKPMHPDKNGFWVGDDETSDCDANPDGHTVGGEIRADPDARTYEVSIPNPEDPHDKPIYEGKADEVHGKLTPGDYRATTMGAGVPVTVWVTETASGIKPSPGPDRSPSRAYGQAGPMTSQPPPVDPWSRYPVGVHAEAEALRAPVDTGPPVSFLQRVYVEGCVLEYTGRVRGHQLPGLTIGRALDILAAYGEDWRPLFRWSRAWGPRGRAARRWMKATGRMR